MPIKTPIKKKKPLQKFTAPIQKLKSKLTVKPKAETPPQTKTKALIKKKAKLLTKKSAVARLSPNPSVSKKISVKRDSAKATFYTRLSPKTQRSVKKPAPTRVKPKVPFSFTLPDTSAQKRESHFTWSAEFLQEVKEKILWVNNVVEKLDEYEDYEAMQTFFEALFDLRRTIDGKLKLFRQNEAKKELEKIFSL